MSEAASIISDVALLACVAAIMGTTDQALVLIRHVERSGMDSSVLHPAQVMDLLKLIGINSYHEVWPHVDIPESAWQEAGRGLIVLVWVEEREAPSELRWAMLDACADHPRRLLLVPGPAAPAEVCPVEELRWSGHTISVGGLIHSHSHEALAMPPVR